MSPYYRGISPLLPLGLTTVSKLILLFSIVCLDPCFTWLKRIQVISRRHLEFIVPYILLRCLDTTPTCFCLSKLLTTIHLTSVYFYNQIKMSVNNSFKCDNTILPLLITTLIDISISRTCLSDSLYFYQPVGPFQNIDVIIPFYRMQ